MSAHRHRTERRHTILDAAKAVFSPRLQGQDVERSVPGRREGARHAALMNAHTSQGATTIGFGR